MDVIYQGETWRRVVTITDDADPPNPVDPDELDAKVCPDWPLTVTGPTEPGVYLVELAAADTATIPAPQLTHWEMSGLVGSDVVPLVYEDLAVAPTCVRLEVTP